MKSMKEIAEGLGRPAVWIAGVQKRFGLPVLESYPEGYESFLRKIVHLRVLGVSEETLREFWAVERKLIEVLHLDPQSSPTWMVNACAFDSDPDRRLLLSNIDLGSPLLATDLQIGLNFAASSPELFAGRDMGEDALRLLSDYRTRLAGIRSSVGSELAVLRGAIKWGKGIGSGGCCRLLGVVHYSSSLSPSPASKLPSLRLMNRSSPLPPRHLPL